MKKLFTLTAFVMLCLSQVIAQDDSNSSPEDSATDSFYSDEPLRNQNISLAVSNGKVYNQGKRLYSKDVEKILDYNAEILANYLKGEKLRTNGNALLTCGIIGSVSGTVLMFSGVNWDAEYDEDIYEANYYIGALVGVLGEVMIAGGIVTGIFGKNKVKKAVDQHNELQYSELAKPKITYEVGFMGNGIGVRLNF